MKLKLPSEFFIVSSRSAACADDTIERQISPISNMSSSFAIIPLSKPPFPFSALFGRTIHPSLKSGEIIS